MPYRCLLFGLLLLLSGRAAAQRHVPADSTVSTDRLVAYRLANDAYFKTDYYFTQGMLGMVVHPALRHLPGARLLRLGGAALVQHFGLRLSYDGFTPLRIQDAFIRRGDRPYAAYLHLELLRAATDRARRRRLTTALGLGVIGPAAGAKGFQTKLHRALGAPTPRGWDYQIRNDLVLSYTARLEQQLTALGRAAELIGGGTAVLGTLRTYAAADARLRVGLFQPYFDHLGVAAQVNRGGQRRWQLYAAAWAEGRLVGYDATLQGGLLRRDNPYELPPGAVRRTVLRGTGTLGLGYAGLRLEASAVQVSPEMRGGRRHRWAQLELMTAF
ncbi:hypothetical protein GCM10027048_08860 [Hymenobacter coalescens]